ncbi:MAG: 16S rRNA processing protein RimM [Fibrobacter sp.]|jgi:16S rRNA processing protein RimM|nr:16S rRNA processing protein RimM [Fibrobacter sp.]
MPEELIAVGKILRTIGLDGLCALEAFGESLEKLELPLDVWIGLNPQTAQIITIVEIKRRPKGLVCRFKGISDLQAAEKIKNHLIFISSQQLPALDQQHFYHFELKGMKVYSDDNRQVGVVEEVFNFPTTDSLEIRRMDGELVLVPMNEDSIVSVDKNKKLIIVRRDFLEELLY